MEPVLGLSPLNRQLADQAEQIRALREQVSTLLSGGEKGPKFQGVKLRAKDPPTFTGEDRNLPVKEWLSTVDQWLKSGACTDNQRVSIAQTYLGKGAASIWKAKVGVLQKEGLADDIGWATFCETLESQFGHQDPEQEARDKLESLKQTGSVERYAQKVPVFGGRDCRHAYVRG